MSHVTKMPQREKTMTLEKGVPSLTGEKVLYWLLAVLTTGASNSEDERTELAQRTQGEAVAATPFSVQLRLSECALPSPPTNTE